MVEVFSRYSHEYSLAAKFLGRFSFRCEACQKSVRFLSFLAWTTRRKATRHIRRVKLTSSLGFLRRSMLLAIYDLQTSHQISGFSLARSKGATAGIIATAGGVLTLWNSRKAKGRHWKAPRGHATIIHDVWNPVWRGASSLAAVDAGEKPAI